MGALRGLRTWTVFLSWLKEERVGKMSKFYEKELQGRESMVAPGDRARVQAPDSETTAACAELCLSGRLVCRTNMSLLWASSLCVRLLPLVHVYGDAVQLLDLWYSPNNLWRGQAAEGASGKPCGQAPSC